MIRFSPMRSNSKLSKRLIAEAKRRGFTNKHLSFSLPAGHSCPFADECKSSANRETGHITDGPNTQFRCYAASQEAVFPQVRRQRWSNYDELTRAYRDGGSVAIGDILFDAIEDANATSFSLFRWHVSGDFFNDAYFKALCDVAQATPTNHYYAYTKALPYVVNHIEDTPTNLNIIASKGGLFDKFIDRYLLRYAEVVFSPDEAKQKGLVIDEDDVVAAFGHKSFGLLIHGVQPAGSEASKAVSALKHLHV